ncbi:cation:proton antiporter [Azospirillum picis]|uniref:NhaP-type Na+/H+ or K+/H+ antiporter n=1 Tax=Azospirillum picis TaxID=488438 RepID=A0ABU0MG47_9PROT|nr:sodium:proton antiporter [Azospirillum picis]MBP2298536.1 NhaP-type Na+/H+ or K+/H+ antiporter [Azospirillum picis]MDQ0532415.1 NhaP-type Na+/H+ or K+/H+ antiporter [Azospirillum picis]
MSYVVMLVALGLLILLVAWLPMVLKEVPLSLPIICVGLGFVVFTFLHLDNPEPLAFPEATERLSELIVIVALMGAGLKLDRRLGWRRWMVTWRLLAITMPLSILIIALIGWWWLDFPVAASVLLGAALAPTDPVLASDIQVGPPKSGEEDEIRFSLTSEAGLNDGLAFPFVHLAIGLALLNGNTPWRMLLDWFAWDLLWKLGAGVAMGWIVGKALAFVTFRVPNRANLSRTGDGFVSLGITFIAYGLTQLVGGYGFLAVFIAALALRDAERNSAYHERLHDFVEQTERLLMMLMLVLFGGTLAHGLINPVTWSVVGAAVVILFVVRPLAGVAGLAGVRMPVGEKLAIGFFGIRGLGSIYYIAFALNAAEFDVPNMLWAVTGLIVLMSILVHGTSVTPVMQRLDRRRQGESATSDGARQPRMENAGTSPDH